MERRGGQRGGGMGGCRSEGVEGWRRGGGMEGGLYTGINHVRHCFLPCTNRYSCASESGFSAAG